jgi:hypothetical protein
MPRAHKTPPTKILFWSKVLKTDTCWLWLGGVNSQGYGKFCVQPRYYGAHRLAYEWEVGPILAETLDHLCRLRICVNPAHLEPVSRRENTLRWHRWRLSQLAAVA